ncbi:FUSC family protein [Streptomyces sp. NPDC002088]|uniref:FUSC family protein n=1 Tax=Streptomyces sp. NPDC002088 TaxID=3154665 RepID=UPI003322C70D
MAASIVAITAVVGLQVGPMAMFGSLIAAWDTGQPLRARLRTYAVVGAVFPVSLGLGVLAGPAPWAAAAVVIAVVLLSVALYHAVAPSGPGPLNLSFACALGAYLGATTDLGGQVVGVTVVSVALTALLTLHDLVRRPHGPEQDAIAAARSAVADFAAGRTEQGDTASAAVHRAWEVLRSAERRRRPSAAHRAMEDELAELNRQLGTRLLEAHYPGDATSPQGWTAVDAVAMPGRPSLGYLLRRAFGRRSLPTARMAALRNALAAGIAVSAAELAHLERPYWAVLSATVILHAGADRTSTTVRGLHRLAGTLLGVAAVAGMEALHPSRGLQLVLVILGAWGMNLLLPRNYTYAVIFATVMAVAANIASAPTSSVATMLTARAEETLLGVGCALVVLWTTGRRHPHRALDRQFRRTVAALARVVEHVHAGTVTADPGRAARRELGFELAAHRALLARTSADAPGLAAWQSVEQAVSRLGHQAFAACWHPHSTDAAQALPHTPRRLRTLLDTLPTVAPGTVDPHRLATALGGPAQTSA